MKMTLMKRIVCILCCLVSMIKRCWAVSGLSILGFVLLYWAYGGPFATISLGIAVTGMLYHMEDYLIYYPENPSHSRVFVPVPSILGMPYENIFARSIDGTLLHLFFIRQPPDRATTAPTVIFLHGNAGNMGHRLHNALGIYQQLGCNLLMLDYRGYGMSQGSPSEEGLYQDAQAALHLLTSRRDVNHNEIIVFGRSLGGSVAIDLACRADCASKIWCVILENTFTSIPAMAVSVMGSKLSEIIRYLPLCLYKNKFLTIQKIPKMERPILFISGLGDNLVPPKMMSQLHGSCGSAFKELLCFDSGTHNETWTCPGYYQAIHIFMAKLRNHMTVPKRTLIPDDSPTAHLHSHHRTCSPSRSPAMPPTTNPSINLNATPSHPRSSKLTII